VQTKDGKEMVFVMFLTDSTYIFQSIAEGESNPTTLNGSSSWNKAGNRITLTNAETKNKIAYKLQGNVLMKVKEKKKQAVEMEANRLQKIDFQEIADKYWKLIEINGNPISENNEEEVYLFLRKSNHRINGSGGCNLFNGQYEIKEENRIKISKVVATMKACLDMETETQLFRNLQLMDNYTISEDGQYLSFTKGKNILGRFEVNYLKIVK